MQVTPGNPKLFIEGKVVKVADEIVNNSLVLQNDDELLVALDANSLYTAELVLIPHTTTGGNVPGLRFAYTAPAGAVGSMGAIYTTAATAVGWTTASGSIVQKIDAADYPLMHAWIVIRTTNAGNLQIQWAQGTAAIEDTKVLAGSFIHWRKIA